MAGARPSGFKKGGGFLNNVDATWVSGEWTRQAPGDSPKKKAKKGEDEFVSLYYKLTARVDGADEDVTTSLWAGGADDFEFEDGDTVLTPVEEGGGLRAGTPFAKLLDSLIEAGFPEAALPEDEISFEAIHGTRVHFVQRKDEEATKRLGKKKDKKTGKEYDRTELAVTDVLALPGKGGKTADKANAAKGNAAKSKAKAAPADDEDDDLSEEAGTILKAILEANDGTVAKAKLPGLLAKQIGAKNPQRDALRKLIFSDEFLETADGWSYDASSKKQEITIDE